MIFKFLFRKCLLKIDNFLKISQKIFWLFNIKIIGKQVYFAIILPKFYPFVSIWTIMCVPTNRSAITQV